MATDEELSEPISEKIVEGSTKYEDIGQLGLGSNLCEKENKSSISEPDTFHQPELVRDEKHAAAIASGETSFPSELPVESSTYDGENIGQAPDVQILEDIHITADACLDEEELKVKEAQKSETLAKKEEAPMKEDVSEKDMTITQNDQNNNSEEVAEGESMHANSMQNEIDALKDELKEGGNNKRIDSREAIARNGSTDGDCEQQENVEMESEVPSCSTEDIPSVDNRIIKIEGKAAKEEDKSEDSLDKEKKIEIDSNRYKDVHMQQPNIEEKTINEEDKTSKLHSLMISKTMEEETIKNNETTEADNRSSTTLDPDKEAEIVANAYHDHAQNSEQTEEKDSNNGPINQEQSPKHHDVKIGNERIEETLDSVQQDKKEPTESPSVNMASMLEPFEEDGNDIIDSDVLSTSAIQSPEISTFNLYDNMEGEINDSSLTSKSEVAQNYVEGKFQVENPQKSSEPTIEFQTTETPKVNNNIYQQQTNRSTQMSTEDILQDGETIQSPNKSTNTIEDEKTDSHEHYSSCVKKATEILYPKSEEEESTDIDKPCILEDKGIHSFDDASENGEGNTMREASQHADVLLAQDKEALKDTAKKDVENKQQNMFEDKGIHSFDEASENGEGNTMTEASQHADVLHAQDKEALRDTAENDVENKQQNLFAKLLDEETPSKKNSPTENEESVDETMSVDQDEMRNSSTCQKNLQEVHAETKATKQIRIPDQETTDYHSFMNESEGSFNEELNKLENMEKAEPNRRIPESKNEDNNQVIGYLGGENEPLATQNQHIEAQGREADDEYLSHKTSMDTEAITLKTSGSANTSKIEDYDDSFAQPPKEDGQKVGYQVDFVAHSVTAMDVGGVYTIVEGAFQENADKYDHAPTQDKGIKDVSLEVDKMDAHKSDEQDEIKPSDVQPKELTEPKEFESTKEDFMNNDLPEEKQIIEDDGRSVSLEQLLAGADDEDANLEQEEESEIFHPENDNEIAIGKDVDDMEKSNEDIVRNHPVSGIVADKQGEYTVEADVQKEKNKPDHHIISKSVTVKNNQVTDDESEKTNISASNITEMQAQIPEGANMKVEYKPQENNVLELDKNQVNASDYQKQFTQVAQNKFDEQQEEKPERTSREQETITRKDEKIERIISDHPVSQTMNVELHSINDEYDKSPQYLSGKELPHTTSMYHHNLEEPSKKANTKTVELQIGADHRTNHQDLEMNNENLTCNESLVEDYINNFVSNIEDALKENEGSPSPNVETDIRSLTKGNREVAMEAKEETIMVESLTPSSEQNIQKAQLDLETSINGEQSSSCLDKIGTPNKNEINVEEVPEDIITDENRNEEKDDEAKSSARKSMEAFSNTWEEPQEGSTKGSREKHIKRQEEGTGEIGNTNISCNTACRKEQDDTVFKMEQAAVEIKDAEQRGDTDEQFLKEEVISKDERKESEATNTNNEEITNRADHEQDKVITHSANFRAPYSSSDELILENKNFTITGLEDKIGKLISPLGSLPGDQDPKRVDTLDRFQDSGQAKMNGAQSLPMEFHGDETTKSRNKTEVAESKNTGIERSYIAEQRQESCENNNFQEDVEKGIRAFHLPLSDTVPEQEVKEDNEESKCIENEARDLDSVPKQEVKDDDEESKCIENEARDHDSLPQEEFEETAAAEESNKLQEDIDKDLLTDQWTLSEILPDQEVKVQDEESKCIEKEVPDLDSVPQQEFEEIAAAEESFENNKTQEDIEKSLREYPVTPSKMVPEQEVKEEDEEFKYIENEAQDLDLVPQKEFEKTATAEESFKNNKIQEDKKKGMRAYPTTLSEMVPEQEAKEEDAEFKCTKNEAQDLDSVPQEKFEETAAAEESFENNKVQEDIEKALRACPATLTDMVPEQEVKEEDEESKYIRNKARDLDSAHQQEFEKTAAAEESNKLQKDIDKDLCADPWTLSEMLPDQEAPDLDSVPQQEFRELVVPEECFESNKIQEDIEKGLRACPVTPSEMVPEQEVKEEDEEFKCIENEAQDLDSVPKKEFEETAAAEESFENNKIQEDKVKGLRAYPTTLSEMLPEQEVKEEDEEFKCIENEAHNLYSVPQEKFEETTAAEESFENKKIQEDTDKGLVSEQEVEEEDEESKCTRNEARDFDSAHQQDFEETTAAEDIKVMLPNGPEDSSFEKASSRREASVEEDMHKIDANQNVSTDNNKGSQDCDIQDRASSEVQNNDKVDAERSTQQKVEENEKKNEYTKKLDEVTERQDEEAVWKTISFNEKRNKESFNRTQASQVGSGVEIVMNPELKHEGIKQKEKQDEDTEQPIPKGTSFSENREKESLNMKGAPKVEINNAESPDFQIFNNVYSTKPNINDERTGSSLKKLEKKDTDNSCLRKVHKDTGKTIEEAEDKADFGDFSTRTNGTCEGKNPNEENSNCMNTTDGLQTAQAMKEESSTKMVDALVDRDSHEETQGTEASESFIQMETIEINTFEKSRNKEYEQLPREDETPKDRKEAREEFFQEEEGSNIVDEGTKPASVSDNSKKNHTVPAATNLKDKIIQDQLQNEESQSTRIDELLQREPVAIFAVKSETTNKMKEADILDSKNEQNKINKGGDVLTNSASEHNPLPYEEHNCEGTIRYAPEEENGCEKPDAAFEQHTKDKTQGKDVELEMIQNTEPEFASYASKDTEERGTTGTSSTQINEQSNVQLQCLEIANDDESGYVNKTNEEFPEHRDSLMDQCELLSDAKASHLEVNTAELGNLEKILEKTKNISIKDEEVRERTPDIDISLHKETDKGSHLKDKAFGKSGNAAKIDENITHAPASASVDYELSHKQIVAQDDDSTRKKGSYFASDTEAPEKEENQILKHQVKQSGYAQEAVLHAIPKTENTEYSSLINQEDPDTTSTSSVAKEQDGTSMNKSIKVHDGVCYSPSLLEETKEKSTNELVMEHTDKNTIVQNEQLDSTPASTDECGNSEEVLFRNLNETFNRRVQQGDGEKVVDEESSSVLKQPADEEDSLVQHQADNDNKTSRGHGNEVGPLEKDSEQESNQEVTNLNSEHEENQQDNLNELPVSRFLLAQILQEPDVHGEGNSKMGSQDKLDAMEHKDIQMPKVDETVAYLSTDSVPIETCIMLDEVQELPSNLGDSEEEEFPCVEESSVMQEEGQGTPNQQEIPQSLNDAQIDTVPEESFSTHIARDIKVKEFPCLQAETRLMQDEDQQTLKQHNVPNSLNDAKSINLSKASSSVSHGCDAKGEEFPSIPAETPLIQYENEEPHNHQKILDLPNDEKTDNMSKASHLASLGHDAKGDEFHSVPSAVTNSVVMTSNTEILLKETSTPRCTTAIENSRSPQMENREKENSSEKETENAMQKDDEHLMAEVDLQAAPVYHNERKDGKKEASNALKELEKVKEVANAAMQEQTDRMPEQVDMMKTFLPIGKTLPSIQHNSGDNVYTPSTIEENKLENFPKMDSEINKEETGEHNNAKLIESQLAVTEKSIQEPEVIQKHNTQQVDHMSDTTSEAAENFHRVQKASTLYEVGHEEAAESQQEKEKTDDENNENSEQKFNEPSHEATEIMVVGEPGLKKAHKKQTIFSGVSSKVKHSIAKVKKAITGKSSQQKPVSPK